METAWITVIGIIITGLFSTTAAIINSNVRAAVTEQKFKDDFEVIKKELSDTRVRLNELQETDSCCTQLKDDVQTIKDNLAAMSEAINQYKADSEKTDALLMKTNMLQIRHTINESYRIFKEIGKIDKQSKDSLQALSDIYINDYHGNSFVEDEMKDIRKLPIV